MRSREFKLFRIVCCFVACLALLVSFLQLFDPLARRGTSETQRSMAFLEKISHGILHFYSEHRYLPWEDPRLKNGEFRHSWRVVLLPSLEKEHPGKFHGATELLQKYRFDEAWDSTHNLRLAEEARNFYSLDRSGTSTSIFALDPPAEGQGSPQETKFEATGMALVQYNAWMTHWMDPCNLSLDRVETLVDHMEKDCPLSGRDPLLVVSSDFAIYRCCDWIEYLEYEARRQAWREYDRRKAEEKSKAVGETAE